MTSAQFIDDRKEVSVPKKGATIAKALSPLGFSLDLGIARITRPDQITAGDIWLQKFRARRALKVEN